VVEIELRNKVHVVIVADEKLETPHIEIQRIKEADMGEHSKPSYERLTAVETAPIPKMGQTLGSTEQPAVSGIVPATPAPIREEAPAPAPAPAATPRPRPASAPAPQGGVISRLLGWFRGAPENAAAPAPTERDRSAQPTARQGRRDERGRPQQNQNAARPARREPGQPAAKAAAPAGKPNHPRQSGNDQAAPRQPQQPPREPRPPKPAPTPVAAPATAVEAQEPRKQAPARPERAPRPPQAERVSAPASEPVNDIEVPLAAAEASAPPTDVKPEAEGGPSRRRRGRRGGRRRRRHEDGTPMQDAPAGQLEELDDEDREESEDAVTPSPVVERSASPSDAPPAAAAVAPRQAPSGTGTVAQAEPRVDTPEVPDTMSPAPAPVAFTLPPLPPIPTSSAQEESSTHAPLVTQAEVAAESAPAEEPAPTLVEPAAPAMLAAEPAPASAPVEPVAESMQPEPVKLRTSPTQGDLLSQATATQTDVQAPTEVSPDQDPTSPKDAAQG